MATQIGSCGTDVLVPEGQEGLVAGAELAFEQGTITELALSGQVTDSKTRVPGGSNFGTAGKGLKDSRILVSGKKENECSDDGSDSEDSIIALSNKLVEDTTVKGKAKTPIDLRISGKFRRSTFDAAKGNGSDSVTSSSTSRFVSSELNLKKGADTVTFTGGMKLVGTNLVRLGKDKQVDNVEFGENTTGKGVLVISQMRKVDTVTVAGEEFTKKQIANGEAPNFIQLPDRG